MIAAAYPRTRNGPAGMASPAKPAPQHQSAAAADRPEVSIATMWEAFIERFESGGRA